LRERLGKTVTRTSSEHLRPRSSARGSQGQLTRYGQVFRVPPRTLRSWPPTAPPGPGRRAWGFPVTVPDRRRFALGMWLTTIYTRDLYYGILGTVLAVVWMVQALSARAHSDGASMCVAGRPRTRRTTASLPGATGL
jgi:hypothetical protein